MFQDCRQNDHIEFIVVDLGFFDRLSPYFGSRSLLGIVRKSFRRLYTLRLPAPLGGYTQDLPSAHPDIKKFSFSPQQMLGLLNERRGIFKFSLFIVSNK